MSVFVDWLTSHFINHKIIREEDAPWFKYGLEKRITTVIVMVPFLIIAALLTNLFTALSFFISFYALRSRTNGFHANHFWSCCIFSILIEIFFLCIIYPLLTRTAIYITSFGGMIIIFFLAPYNHSNMHLSKQELSACRLSARTHSLCILIVVIITGALNVMEVAKGFTLGMTMVAFLLCLAYLLKGGSSNEKGNRCRQKNA